MKRVELLAPAGSLEKLKIACIYGADAVFLGGQEFGLRSNAQNFTIEEIKQGVEFAKEYGVKVYVTTNIYAHEVNFNGFKEYVMKLEQIGVVGLIISDPGYIKIAKEFAPKLEIHISTQQSIANKYSAKFFDDLGADRVVLARELSIKEIKEVAQYVDCEIEVFIHGAVCSSYSGRCTLSNHLTSRDSNRGGCAQSCRWYYDLSKEDENGEIKPITLKDEKHNFTMSAKDMQLLNYIPQMVETGVNSFKIEGRMKSLHYLATVVKVYKEALDFYYENPDNYKVKESWLDEIQKAETRETYEGALIGDFSHKDQIFGEQYQSKKYDYCAQVLDYDNKRKLVKLRQRNFFKVGDTIEFFGPGKNIEVKVSEILNEEFEKIEKANHPLMEIYVPLDEEIESNWLVRKEN